MACALTSAYALDCSDGVGGIKNVYITELANIANYTVSGTTGAIITALSLNAGKQFFKYELEKETGEYTEGEPHNLQNGTLFYEPVVKFTIRKMSNVLRSEFNNMAKLRLCVIVLDRNGNYWITGLMNGLEKMNGKNQTGKAFGDFNGYEIELHGKEEQPAYGVSASVLAGLITPGL